MTHATVASRVSSPTWPVRPVSHVQLRALRSLLARVEGVRRSQVRVAVRPDTFSPDDHIELAVRVMRASSVDPYAFSWSALTPRGVVGRVARRAWERDLP